MYHNTANKLVIINTNNNEFFNTRVTGFSMLFQTLLHTRTQNKHTVNKYTPSKTDNTLHIKGKQCGDKTATDSSLQVAGRTGQSLQDSLMPLKMEGGCLDGMVLLRA